MAQGMIHIYCGDGKGKTSAAVGLAVRAAGCGLKVLFARFLKNEDSGELEILDSIPGIEVIHMERSYGFFRTLSRKEQEEVREMYGALWRKILVLTGTAGTSLTGAAGNNAVSDAPENAEAFGAGELRPFDMLVMDEFMAAYNYGLIPHEEALKFLAEKPEHLEIVLTGRNPDARLTELADYVSEIRKIKHPFDRGITARRGIEY